MALNIESTKTKFDQYLAYFESRLNQTSPLADKAFLRVLAGVLAMKHTEFLKYAAERAVQNLAITATGEDLAALGREYGVTRIPAASTVLVARATATTGTVIPVTATWIGDANGMRYFMQASATAVAGVVDVTVVAEEAGAAGNLIAADTITLTAPIPGSSSLAAVTSVSTTGTEAEGDDAYRVRVLDEIRRIGGGGNAADYRIWSQEVAGVKRAYPYSGKPFGTGGTHYPPDRTVYIEATADIDPDGVPTDGLIDQVRANITTNPVTGLTRQPLGMTDETLYIEKIIVIDLYVQIYQIMVDDEAYDDAITAIEAAILAYTATVRPWIAGLDPDGERYDLVTAVTLSDVVQDALTAFNGTAQKVFFGIAPFEWIDQYRLNPGEIMVLLHIDYV